MSQEVPTTASPESHKFQAEIQQLLDIVIHSLYTHRDVFLRELVSNAADALERFRHEGLVNPEIPNRDDELKITVEADKDGQRLVIADNGDGMSHDQLIENLGSIARSGTKNYLKNLADAAKSDVNLIGQFGVGFYSAFMVAKKVTVDTRSFHSDSQGWRWESDGTGGYEITPNDEASRGTRITLVLKDDCDEFADPVRVREVIQKFSNFVGYPIELAGDRVNTVQALWAKSKSDVTDDEYNEFYRFIANDPQEPLFRFHFKTDAPLSINALLFVPKNSMERMGFGRMKPGVDLHCRKVLIMKGPEELLPEWMRFARGVIDSEDLPLNISREMLQDNRVIRKLANVITGRFLKFLEEMAKDQPEDYAQFIRVFGPMLKEGAVQDHGHREAIAKLLRFESSKTEEGKTTSLADYVERMPGEQEDIYYINGPSRAAIEAGPYIEALKQKDYEVLYAYEGIDDFVFNHLGEFEGKKLVSADSGDLDIEAMADGEGLEGEALEKLVEWIKTTLGDRVAEVKPSKRLVNSPAAVTTAFGMTNAMQRIFMAANGGEGGMTPPATLEINPRHPLVGRIQGLRLSDEDLARSVTEQVFDNALLSAGLLTDPQRMAERLNALLLRAAGGSGS